MIQFSLFKKVFSEEAFWKKKKKGSALIMTMIMLVNAVLIMSVLTAISYRESKSSGLTKISAMALQGADSGMEWALDEYYGITDPADPSQEINDFYTQIQDNDLVLELSDILKNGAAIKIYFIDDSNEVLQGSDPISEVKYIRSVGTVQAGGGLAASRAFQAQVK